MSQGQSRMFTAPIFSPMLAYQKTPETPAQLGKLKFPMLMSPKLDGIRMTNYGQIVSRTNKMFPSAYVKKRFGRAYLLGIDGEAIKGEPTSPTVFSDTFSAMMTQGSMEPVTWYVFDYCSPGSFSEPYSKRLQLLQDLVEKAVEDESVGKMVILPQDTVKNWDDVLVLEAKYLELGYEGGIIRSPDAPYKFGRSTLNENYLIKIKRFETCEAIIEDFFELMHNDNEEKRDGTGHIKRSSHQAGMRPGNTLGGFHVRDLATGVRFNLGSGLGLTADLRRYIWANRDKFKGRIVSYKKLKVGEKDKPRNCTFRGFRDPIDM